MARATELCALRFRIRNVISATTPVPSSITNAIRATHEQETPDAAFPQAAAILQGYLSALEANSTATLT